ncbi:MAG: hypothetical protein JEZ08_09575 [Clostridiales bacterium]|nr:hypothetical protein [Clostridiales bacterium]
MDIVLKPLQVSEEILDRLEQLGVISRIKPGKHILETEKGESKHETVYGCDDHYGPHKLICVTINNSKPTNFLYHNDNEDFMLIDLNNRAGLVITMALVEHRILEQKIENNTIDSKDFISVIFEPNDAFTSFFTMNKGFAHVETCLFESDAPPSFYVAESRDLDENHIDFKGYQLRIEV